MSCLVLVGTIYIDKHFRKKIRIRKPQRCSEITGKAPSGVETDDWGSPHALIAMNGERRGEWTEPRLRPHQATKVSLPAQQANKTWSMTCLAVIQIIHPVLRSHKVNPALNWLLIGMRAWQYHCKYCSAMMYLRAASAVLCCGHAGEILWYKRYATKPIF